MAASGVILSPSPASQDIRLPRAWHTPSLVQGKMDAPAGMPLGAQKAIRIFLIIAKGPSTVPIEVLNSDAITSASMQIQAHRGFYVNNRRLVHYDRELTQDQGCLADFGVLGGGEALHLILHLSELVNISITTAESGLRTFQVKTPKKVKDSVRKQVLEKEKGLLLEQLLLTLRGFWPDDETAIEDLLQGEQASLHLFIKKPVKCQTKRVDGDLELTVSVSPLRNNSSSGNEAAHLKPEGIKQPNVLELARYTSRLRVPESVWALLEQARAGLLAGHTPSLSDEGSGGVYFLKDELGLENVAVFKPADEEPMAPNNPRGFTQSNEKGEGLKSGTRVREGAMAEVAAYILDYPANSKRNCRVKDGEGFSAVPPTFMVRCFHEGFNFSEEERRRQYRNAKVGSLQKFVQALGSCEDMGPSKFPVEEVHKITVLDLRLANADRHSGNILVSESSDGHLRLIPIDHGYCLPETFEECTFEWLFWPQASVPYQRSTLEYIASLDAEEDIAVLRRHGVTIHPKSAHVLRVATMVLKKGAAAGLNPFQIGSILSRVVSLEDKSPIELLLDEALRKEQLFPTGRGFFEILSGLLDSHISMIIKSS